ncbi:hypothetical protein Pyn_00531 [Prunus yedoensis var. nudiflora]|uniref:Aminotransferase class V domain-containing protein n=1 Tax=Prunus yedoensis var. nudiflora TaxID=2094558 RepID=A0A314UM82_PRUYE|nr:hypothetical protein Pyn_00531 [Prunus yedoensis var. nudiflora]
MVGEEEGVEQVFIDAAHAVGSVDVDMQEIGADFYASTLYGKGLAEESFWVGSRDYSPYLVLPSVMEFVNRFEGGLKGIIKMNHDAVVEMGKMLAEAWGTNLGCPPDMCLA